MLSIVGFVVDLGEDEAEDFLSSSSLLYVLLLLSLQLSLLLAISSLAFDITMELFSSIPSLDLIMIYLNSSSSDFARLY